ncbi:hypothetical protein FUAX_30110 [Fulvitalea axinellae]|uniref:FecR family protein n=1 Tax=Fulvitalea axinellae TaxID=1182444 RepID=A0AAU9D7Q3_9BACT|nr:hypothetical protein FUAX_30110 [Fulvitalea axinellae]
MEERELILTRYLFQEATEEEVAMVEQWCKEDPEFKVTVERRRVLLRQTRAGAEVLSGVFADKGGTESLRQRTESRKRQSVIGKKPEKAVVSIWKTNAFWGSMAASVLVLFALSYSFLSGDSEKEYSDYNLAVSDSFGIYEHGGGHKLFPLPAKGIDLAGLKHSSDTVFYGDGHRDAFGSELMHKAVVPEGERLVLYLSDGSRVLLGGGSALVYPKRFGPKNRTVALNGEAEFEVTKDASRPFSVLTESGEVNVLGTVFRVRARENSQEQAVSLLEGSVLVRFTDTGKEFRLKPGQSVVRRGERVELSTGTLEWKNLEWKRVTGKVTLDCGGKTLGEMIPEIESFYGLKIVCENKRLLDVKLTGTFSGNDVSELLRVLGQSEDLEYVFTDNRTRLYLK